MVTIRALDELTPADLWSEVPLEQEFWQVAQERQRHALKLLSESALEEEMVALVAAGRFVSRPQATTDGVAGHRQRGH